MSGWHDRWAADIWIETSTEQTLVLSRGSLQCRPERSGPTAPGGGILERELTKRIELRQPSWAELVLRHHIHSFPSFWGFFFSRRPFFRSFFIAFRPFSGEIKF